MRLGINEYLLSFKTIAELNNELDDKLIIYKKKKDSLAEKLIILEKKIAQVAKLQKESKGGCKVKGERKEIQKKAKNLNELVQGVKRKKTIKKKQMLVR